MKEIIDWKGKKYLMEWFDSEDFTELIDVCQAYAFVFNSDHKICVVDCNHENWSLPGGTPEDYDETFEDTLIREVEEEADIVMKNIKPIGYSKVTRLDSSSDTKPIYQLRYIAEVDSLCEQSIDPATGLIPHRKFVSRDEFNSTVNWGKHGENQLDKAWKVYINSKKDVL
jgi:ADP-ribose pyrophosphatase YjhB (NUDIX family)